MHLSFTSHISTRNIFPTVGPSKKKKNDKRGQSNRPGYVHEKIYKKIVSAAVYKFFRKAIIGVL